MKGDVCFRAGEWNDEGHVLGNLVYMSWERNKARNLAYIYILSSQEELKVWFEKSIPISFI